MDLGKFVCYVGTARGFLLNTTDKPSEIKAAKPEQASEVTGLTFGKNDEEIYVGYESGQVNCYSTVENKYVRSINSLEGEGRIVGLKYMEKNLIAARKDGIINIWRKRKNNHFDIKLDEKSTLDCMVYNEYRENIIATGGEHNDYKLWDIETHQNIFKAKSLGHDILNLPIPTTVRGITFFPVDPFLGACCTKEGHVLLYDERAQRRPVAKFLETKASYSTISCAYRERQCLVGTTKGYMQLVDMKAGKCLKTFTTFTGSLTSIICDPLEPYVTTTSLDRFLRIHNLETKELLHKIYMKQNLTTLLVKPIVKEEYVEEKENGVVDQEYEDIFNNMEVINDIKDKTSSKAPKDSTNSMKVKTEKRKIKTSDLIQKKKKKKKVIKPSES